MDEPKETRREIVISGTKNGLGIRIVGGRSAKQSASDNFGIFIKEVIHGSLAERDGSLRRGDQLLEANGKTLVGVLNESAVEILKSCALTNQITFLISRDDKSKLDFRRLSNSLLQATDDHFPRATSTPRNAQPVINSEARKNGGQEDDKDSIDEAKRLSTSSDLTQVSTTDISSHGDDLENELIDRAALNKNLQNNALEHSQKSIALSDVILEESSVGKKSETNEGFPPPVPTSLPPSLDMDDNEQIKPTKWKPGQAEVAGSAAANVILRDRSSPEGKARSPPLSASMFSSFPFVTHTFVIPKTAGLGVILGGGEGKPDGPHIFIDKILDGMDAKKDGNLKLGDRLISINGEDLRNMKREKALAILSQIKTKRSETNYNVTIERNEEKGQDLGPPTSLTSPQRSTDLSIFNSDTLRASNVSKSHGDSFSSDSGSPSKKSAPLRYLAKRDSDRKKDRTKQDSMHNRLSMDPSARCKLSKLEWALKYMGYTINPQQQKEIHLSLDIDESGRVVFMEFVKLAQEMFAFKLDDSRLETNLMLALTHKEDMDMPPMPRKSTSYEHIWDPSLKEPLIKPASSQPILPLASSSNSIRSDDELEQMRRKLHEVGYHRDKEKMLNESVRKDLEKEKQLSAYLKKELKRKEEEHSGEKTSSSLPEESDEVLLKRIRLTEDAHKAERDRSNHLEDEMLKMNAELSVLREHQPKLSLEQLRKRMAIIDNELNKEKAESRRNQVAVERLMKFVENCHEVLVKSPDVDRILYHPHGKGSSVQRGNVVTGNPRPPQYLSRHAKQTATSLAKEAQETMAAVRKMMESDALPYGWQEAYTESGQKYYINHETQMTSWTHPVTKVNSGSIRGSRSSTQSLASGHSTPTPAFQ